MSTTATNVHHGGYGPAGVIVTVLRLPISMTSPL